MSTPKFPLGRIVGTPGSLAFIEKHEIDGAELLRRHRSGDWGDCCDEDKEVNEQALKDGGRLMSVYKFGDDKIWIITEWDRSATTVLLPSEY